MKNLSSGFEKNKRRATTTTAKPPRNTILSPSGFLWCFCWVLSTLNLTDNHQQSPILCLSYMCSVWLAEKSFNLFFPFFFPPTKQHGKSTPESEVLGESCCGWRESRHCWWRASTESPVCMPPLRVILAKAMLSAEDSWIVVSLDMVVWTWNNCIDFNPILAMLLCRKRYKVQGETNCRRAVGCQQVCLSKVMAGVLDCSVHLVFPANACLN